MRAQKGVGYGIYRERYCNKKNKRNARGTSRKINDFYSGLEAGSGVMRNGKMKIVKRCIKTSKFHNKMGGMKCINCGKEIKKAMKYCSECGCKLEAKCMYCGNILGDTDRFCSICGHGQGVEGGNPTPVQDTTEQEIQSVSTMDKIINSVLSSENIKGLTNDTYRNELVKKFFIYNLILTVVGIVAWFLAYRVYKEADFTSAIITIIFMAILESVICRMFKVNNSEKILKKYDTILNEIGRDAAILAIESTTTNKDSGCLVSCFLILIIIVLMSFC